MGKRNPNRPQTTAGARERGGVGCSARRTLNPRLTVDHEGRVRDNGLMPNTLTRRMREATRRRDTELSHVTVRLSLTNKVSPVLRNLIAEADEHVQRRAAEEAAEDAMAFAKTRGEYVVGGMQRDEEAIVARMREVLGTPRPNQNIRSPERALIRDLNAQRAVDMATGYVECSGAKVVGRHRRATPVPGVWYRNEEAYRNGWFVYLPSDEFPLFELDPQRDMVRIVDMTTIEQCAHFFTPEVRPREFERRERCQRDAAGPGEQFCELHAR